MESDAFIDQIVDIARNPIKNNNLKLFIQDGLNKYISNNHQTLHDNLRNCKEEKEAFRKSAEFWRGEYLKQADALDKLKVKII